MHGGAAAGGAEGGSEQLERRGGVPQWDLLPEGVIEVSTLDPLASARTQP